MKKLILLSVLCLSGCITIPVKQTFPELPAELQKACPQLATIDTPEVTLSELMKIVAKNYGSRHECAAQVESMQQWYEKQKKIFDDANK